MTLEITIKITGEDEPQISVKKGLASRTCPQCGDPFKPKVHNQIVCSPECKRNRKRERQAKEPADHKPVTYKVSRTPGHSIIRDNVIATKFNSKGDTITPKQAVRVGKMRDPTISNDPFYREQLAKAARTKKVYIPYLSQ